MPGVPLGHRLFLPLKPLNPLRLQRKRWISPGKIWISPGKMWISPGKMMENVDFTQVQPEKNPEIHGLQQKSLGFAQETRASDLHSVKKNDMFRQQLPTNSNNDIGARVKTWCQKQGQILITPNSVSNVSSHVKSTSQVEECFLLLRFPPTKLGFA